MTCDFCKKMWISILVVGAISTMFIVGLKSEGIIGKPEFKITKEECRNESFYEYRVFIYNVENENEILQELYTPDISVGIYEISKGLRYYNQFKNVSYNYEIWNTFLEEVCEQVEVDEIIIEKVEYGIKKISKNISFNYPWKEQINYTAILKSEEGFYISVSKDKENLKYGICTEFDGNNFELSTLEGEGLYLGKWGHNGECNLENFTILEYDELINYKEISKQELTTTWLYEKCESHYRDFGIDNCNIKKGCITSICGEYTVEVLQ